ncbi:MAG: hypothetical protein HN353_06480 [Bdellovibrionales bacterium]|nr:hypothetical protein [Bdellovibrionales bacterium]MBT3526280.1 hypothetical protein [Bdellovibrionales bacterium]
MPNLPIYPLDSIDEMLIRSHPYLLLSQLTQGNFSNKKVDVVRTGLRRKVLGQNQQKLRQIAKTK